MRVPPSPACEGNCGLAHYFAVSSALEVIGTLGCGDEKSLSGKALLPLCNKSSEERIANILGGHCPKESL